MKVICHNRRAHFKYHVMESFDGGLVLNGPEVKSLRAGSASLEDGFGRADTNDIYLWNVHIAPYKQGPVHLRTDPTRKRKILLHRPEIKRILGKMTTKGLTLIPLELYFSDSGYAKVKLGLAKAKNAPDQREDLKRKDLTREMRRDFSGRHKF